MSTDENEIRQLTATWMAATKAGDGETVLSLMTEDVVFLVPGQPPMKRDDFAKAASAQAGPVPAFDGISDIQEITVVGDWAFMWTKLRVTITPTKESPPTVRSGHTLSVLRKQHGKWLLARDANLLVPENGTP